MGNLPEFVMNHLALVIIFVGLLAYLLYTEYQNQSGSNALSPQQAVNLMNHESAIVLDLRPNATFESGHIINAINITSDKLENTENYKNKKIILVCENGQSTPMLSNKLKSKGFEHVYCLKGGMSAWRQADLPSTT